MTENTKNLAESIIPNDYKTKKIFAVMLFNTEIELGISNTPNKWVNTKNYKFNDGTSALDFYANTPNPASQLIDATSEEELESKMNDMIHNFQNENWLEENLYPYL